MTDPSPALLPELTEAKRIARAAWERIAHYYGGDYKVTNKSDGPATDADREANAFIVSALAARFPGDGMLSEEAADNTERFGRERVWIVDPIDGTNDFISGSGNFAVQIGLAVRGDDGYSPHLGVVYHPTQDTLYCAARGEGAWMERTGAEPERLAVSVETELRCMTAVATKNHRTPLFLELMDRLGVKDMITMGSLGLKVVWVAAGRADFYLNNARGMCKEWDICAPEAILAEAGGIVADLTGAPLRYNQQDVRVTGGILASSGSCHEALRERILAEERVVTGRG